MDWTCPERGCCFYGVWEDLEVTDGACQCPSCGADLDLDPETIAESVVPAVARREARYYAATAKVISNSDHGAWIKEMLSVEQKGGDSIGEAEEAAQAQQALPLGGVNGTPVAQGDDILARQAQNDGAVT